MSESADLSGLRAVVTGATSGLGAAMADALLEAGATVAIAARPGPRLDEAVARRTQRGLAAQAMALKDAHLVAEHHDLDVLVRLGPPR